MTSCQYPIHPLPAQFTHPTLSPSPCRRLRAIAARADRLPIARACALCCAPPLRSPRVHAPCCAWDTATSPSRALCCAFDCSRPSHRAACTADSPRCAAWVSCARPAPVMSLLAPRCAARRRARAEAHRGASAHEACPRWSGRGPVAIPVLCVRSWCVYSWKPAAICMRRR